jgi:hypothetical protein
VGMNMRTLARKIRVPRSLRGSWIPDTSLADWPWNPLLDNITWKTWHLRAKVCAQTYEEKQAN